jgi:hypothetical protein
VARKQVVLRVSDVEHARFLALAAERGMSLSALIRHLLDECAAEPVSVSADNAHEVAGLLVGVRSVISPVVRGCSHLGYESRPYCSRCGRR